MARKLDRILVIDVEATCWNGPIPDGQTNEIIEIGLSSLDVRTLERADRRSILVRPERSTISAFCTELTTITQAQIDDDGISFARACHILKKEYASKRRAWSSWGDYDRRQFERQCRDSGVGYPFGATHLNIKHLFALAGGLAHEVGMAGALEQLGWEIEGTHHRGVDDAQNIARILGWLLDQARTSGKGACPG